MSVIDGSDQRDPSINKIFFRLTKIVYFTIVFWDVDRIKLVNIFYVLRDWRTYVKTLRSPLSAEFWRQCELSGGTQRRALHYLHHLQHGEEMKI